MNSGLKHIQMCQMHEERWWLSGFCTLWSFGCVTVLEESPDLSTGLKEGGFVNECLIWG